MLRHWWDIVGMILGISVWLLGFDYFLDDDFYVFCMSLISGTYLIVSAIKGIMERNR